MTETIEECSNTVKEKSFIDLFSGTGAFSLALEKQGYKCVYSNDIALESRLIYELNNSSNCFELCDINTINVNKIKPFNILCGGFPCQPFSIAGKKEGFDDIRSNVFWKLLEIINVHKPRFFILENVKNLTTHDKCNTFKIITDSFKSLGYFIKYDVLDTCKITSIPHHRERVYIIGFKSKDDFDKFNFNFKKKELLPISNFLEDKIENKYYYTIKSKIYDRLVNDVVNDISTNTVYQYRRHYIRENKSKVVPTLTANMGSGGHNVPIINIGGKIRKLTPRECFNLQGFPRDYKLPCISDSRLYKLAGNAVSIPVIEMIIKNLIFL